MRKRIVVAEDDADLRELVATTLREQGHEVVEVADGGRLLVLLARCSRAEELMPDLIVSDVQMPVMSGLDMLKGVRDAHWHLPVLLMTAFPNREVEWRAGALAADILRKPFPLESLRQAVASALR